MLLQMCHMGICTYASYVPVCACFLENESVGVNRVAWRPCSVKYCFKLLNLSRNFCCFTLSRNYHARFGIFFGPRSDFILSSRNQLSDLELDFVIFFSSRTASVLQGDQGNKSKTSHTWTIINTHPRLPQNIHDARIPDP